MRLFVSFLFAVVAVTSAQHQQQQQVDPAYLRQYYAQQQQAGAQGGQRATPIYEAQEQPQYAQQGGPLKSVSLIFSPLLCVAFSLKGWIKMNKF